MNNTVPQKKKRLRALALAALVCFVVFSVWATVFIVEHENHDCAGDHCAICLQLRQAHQLLKGAVPGIATPFLGFAAGSLLLSITRALGGKPAYTLVLLKVQLNR